MAESIESKQKPLFERYPNFNILYKTSNELFFDLRDMWTGKAQINNERVQKGEEIVKEIEEIIQDMAGDRVAFENRIKKDEISFHKDGRLSGDEEFLKQIYIIKMELDGILRRLKKV